MTQPAHYPKRDGFFAGKFCRLMTKVCLANQIGADGCYLLMTVAMTEDAKSYRSPVTYWNEQLLPLLGLSNVKALARVRDRVVSAGWLHYEPGGKGRIGTYWVTVPPEFDRMDDTPVDENAAEYQPVLSDKTDVQSGSKAGNKAGGRRAAKREKSGQPSSLSLPIPDQEEDCGVPPPDGQPAQRPRDEIFDFLLNLTGSNARAHGSRIGKLKKWLLESDPPHTMDEIRTLGDPGFLARELGFLRGTKPNLNQIESVIGRIRSPSSCQTKLSGGRPHGVTEIAMQAMQHLIEDQMADQTPEGF